MSVIKKFFSKKKEEAAFKLKLGGGLGQGHILSAENSEASSSCQKSICDAYVPPKRKDLSTEAKSAAAAALARIEKKESKESDRSLAFIRQRARKELEAELENENSQSDTITENNANVNVVFQGVFFRCPILGEEILTKAEWKNKIRNFLYQQLEEEKGLTSCLIIRNCNSEEKAEECITILTKYLENIINYPEEEKYYKIRMSNRIFSEKVRCVEGALNFLQAAGFQEICLDNEQFLVWSRDNVEKDYDLVTLLEALDNSEPIKLVLDRNIKVLLPSQAKCIVNLPDDFYRISPEEIKRERNLRAEAVENSQILKTKAMREREEKRTTRLYKYSLVRVKFPTGLYLQGTFSVYEKLSDVFEFVRSCLQDETLEFQLASSEGKFKEEDMDKTLCNLRLIPNVLLFFNVRNEISASDTDFIKEDLLHLLQSI